MTAPVDIEEGLRLEAEATPGPWYATPTGRSVSRGFDPIENLARDVRGRGDAEFMVFARNNFRAMAEELRELRKWPALALESDAQGTTYLDALFRLRAENERLRDELDAIRSQQRRAIEDGE